MISTLLVTIITESPIAVGYCIWRKKPVLSVLLTSIGANIFTQVFLWGVLSIFFQHYLAALLISEQLIWILEGLSLYYVRTNQLRFTEAITLSLSMNVVSFVLGLFLPI